MGNGDMSYPLQRFPGPVERGERKGNIPLVSGPCIQSPVNVIEEQPAKPWDEHDVRQVEKYERVYEEIEVWPQVFECEYVRYRTRKILKDRIVRLERGRKVV